MPEIVADPPSPSCYRLFPGSGIQEFQQLGPDLLLPRTREVRERFANGPSSNAEPAASQPVAGFALQPKEESRCRFAADCTILDSL